MQKMIRHSTDSAPALSNVRPELPTELSAVVEKMMAKEPKNRYQTPSQVADALAPFTQVTRRPDLPSISVTGKGRKKIASSDLVPSRRRWSNWYILTIVGAFIVLLALAVAVYRIQTDHGELVISVHDEDVEVLVKKGGKLVKIVDTKTGKVVTLDSGAYELELKGETDHLKLSKNKVTIYRGKETLVATVVRTPLIETAKGKVETDVTKVHPPGILQVWEGEWTNSFDESGEMCCFLIETADGKVHGRWSGVKVTGQRVNASTWELKGNNDTRSYQFTAMRQDDTLTIKYLTTVLGEEGTPYEGTCKLKLVPGDTQIWEGAWSNNADTQGDAWCYLIEDDKGNIRGNWDDVKFSGKRVNPTTLELTGSTESRSYQVAATFEAARMLLKYVARDLDGQELYVGQSTLTRIR
jgi:hypothetical protein